MQGVTSRWSAPRRQRSTCCSCRSWRLCRSPSRPSTLSWRVRSVPPESLAKSSCPHRERPISEELFPKQSPVCGRHLDLLWRIGLGLCRGRSPNRIPPAAERVGDSRRFGIQLAGHPLTWICARARDVAQLVTSKVPLGGVGSPRTGRWAIRYHYERTIWTPRATQVSRHTHTHTRQRAVAQRTTDMRHRTPRSGHWPPTFADIAASFHAVPALCHGACR